MKTLTYEFETRDKKHKTEFRDFFVAPAANKLMFSVYGRNETLCGVDENGHGRLLKLCAWPKRGCWAWASEVDAQAVADELNAKFPR